MNALYKRQSVKIFEYKTKHYIHSCWLTNLLTLKRREKRRGTQKTTIVQTLSYKLIDIWSTGIYLYISFDWL